MLKPDKNFLINALLLCLSILFSLAVLEIVYRVYIYHNLKKTITAQLLQSSNDWCIYDSETGYRYKPNLNVTNSPGKGCWKTNQHGLVSNEDYPVEKPLNEYRIIVIGDSFTANINETVRWADVLQEKLNQSDEWKAAAGGKFTRVINCGHDGIGVQQMGAVFQYRALEFQPDLVIVNFIADDVVRKFFSRGQTNFKSEEERRQFIKKYVQETQLDPLPWRGIYSEVLATILGPFGKHVGMPRRLIPFSAGDGNLYFRNHPRDNAKQISAAVEIFKKAQKTVPHALFLNHPMFEELTGTSEKDMPWLNGLLEQLVAEAKSHHIEIILMRNHLSMPIPQDRAELMKWFNFPIDTHNSDLGVRIYGESVAHLIIQRRSVLAP
ncbi:MAG: SGNH/GDSL hydrolase family protein [Verrucomicrobiota bacterium]